MAILVIQVRVATQAGQASLATVVGQVCQVILVTQDSQVILDSLVSLVTLASLVSLVTQVIQVLVAGQVIVASRDFLGTRVNLDILDSRVSRATLVRMALVLMVHQVIQDTQVKVVTQVTRVPAVTVARLVMLEHQVIRVGQVFLVTRDIQVLAQLYHRQHRRQAQPKACYGLTLKTVSSIVM